MSVNDSIWRYGQSKLVKSSDGAVPFWSYGRSSVIHKKQEGWVGKVLGVSNPVKIMGIAAADVAKVAGVG